MSMVLTRSPLEPIGMNGAGSHAGASKRRSARLSAEGADENGDAVMGPPASKRSKTAMASATTTTVVGTKEVDGEGGAAAKRTKRVYDQEDDDFSFSKSKKSKAKAAPAVRNSDTRKASPEPQPQQSAPAQAASDDAPPKTAQKKARRRLPTTPERDAADKIVRRSKRLSNEDTSDNHASPHKPAHARSHAKHDRSPSPEKAGPLTVEKKRKRGADGVEEEKVMRIQLPFADTPVIKRNKEMRKASAENAHRRSSSGMRGRRASSLIDEGRGNGELAPKRTSLRVTASAISALSTGLSGRTASGVKRPQSNSESESGTSGLSTFPPSDDLAALPHDLAFVPPITIPSANENAPLPALPHSEVPAAEFYKHISAALTEPRRMRCLLGWCGTRTLPPKPEAPKDSTPASNDEFQALQAARVIQAELSQDMITKGILSDWFSRDDEVAPQIPLRKKPNPRNVANAAKAEELERELERLKKERSEWEEVITSAAQATAEPSEADTDATGVLSPLHPELLDSPQRRIVEQLQAPTSQGAADPDTIGQKIRNISRNLEFTVDQFAHGVHALSTTREAGERLAERSLSDAAGLLEEREKQRKAGASNGGKGIDAMDALRGLARVLNSGRR